MKPINKQEPIVKKLSPQDNPTQSAGNRQKHTKSFEAHDISALHNRELSLSTENSYGEEVAKIMKEYAFHSIALINQTLRDHGYSRDILESDPINDSMQDLAFQYGTALHHLRKHKIEHFYEKQMSEGKSKNFDIRYTPFASDIVSNALFSWLALVQIFQKFFEYNEDRKIFLQFEPTKTPNDIVVEGIGPLIEETIIGLEKIREEQYFPKFKSSIDPNIDLKSKFKIFFHYWNFPESDLLKLVESCTISKNNLESATNSINEVVEAAWRNMACYATKIQISIDCLKKVQSLPQTVKNLKIMYQVFGGCYSYFKEDLATMAKLKTTQPRKVCDDYFMTKDYLLQQLKKFAAQINQATIQNNAELESKRNINKQHNIPTPPIKSLSQNHPQNKKQEPTTVLPLQQTETPLELKPTILQELKNDESGKNPTDIILETKATENIPEQRLKANPDEESLDEEIKRLNELLERLFEKDREKKRLHKVAQTQKPQNNQTKELELPTQHLTTESVTIKTANLEFTFQKLYHSTFLTDVLGVIINNNSVELQTLSRYQQLLSNATIGSGSISQLKGFGNIYEIGSSTLDSRLLGKKYNDGILVALLKFLPESEAILVSQELKKHGINDNISLIIFSAEAKKHSDINSLARML